MPSSTAYFLLSGASGLLGRYLMKDLLLAGARLAVVVRASRRATAAQRVEAILQGFEATLGRPLPRPVVLEGELVEPNFGLSPQDQSWVAEHCTQYIHNAANLTFHATSDDGEPYRSNVEGTRNALELCRETGIRTFHHVSTAYVAGLRSGRILESELDVGQQPGNDYERSKIAAEKMVLEADFLESRTVFRPSIIIGDSQTGFTNTFHGFYVPLQIAVTLCRSYDPNPTGRVQNITRMPFQGTERKHFVPVDWVAAAMAHILLRPEFHGQTYHLTPRRPTPLHLLADVLEDLAGFYPLHMTGQPSDTAVEGVEAHVMDNMQVYDAYFRDDPQFDSTNTRRAFPVPCPHVDRDMLIRLGRWAIERNFTVRERAPRIDFDAHLHLEPLAASDLHDAADGEWIALQVLGPGGGEWTIGLVQGQPVCAERGLDERARGWCRIESDLLADIVQGRATVDDARTRPGLQASGVDAARLLQGLAGLAAARVS